MLTRIAALAVAGAVCVAAFAAWRSSAETGPALIRISGTETRSINIDIGKRGRSPGDSQIITQLLYNRRITERPIGRSEIVCTYTIGASRSCRGTYFLQQGTLVVGGSLRHQEIYELAIVGGTGLYNNARGTLTATQTRRVPRREFLIFRLAG